MPVVFRDTLDFIYKQDMAEQAFSRDVLLSSPYFESPIPIHLQSFPIYAIGIELPDCFAFIGRNLKEELSAKAEQQKAIRTRDEFLSTASHELKTPITSLQLQLELLKNYMSANPIERLDEAIKESLSQFETEFNRLTDLVNDLLDVTRIVNGKLPLNCQDIDLDMILKSVVRQMTPPAKKNRVILSYQGEGSLLINGDESRIRQVVINLISNAIKFGNEKPVLVRLRSESKLLLNTGAHYQL